MSDISIIQHNWTTGALPADTPKAHLVFADPPYNQSIAYADDDTRDSLTGTHYQSATECWIRHINHCLLPGGRFWWMTPERHADWTGELLTRIVGPRLFRIVWQESFAQYQGDRGLTMDYRFIFCHRKWDASATTLMLPRWNPHAIRIKSARQEMGDKRANPNGRVPGCVWNFRRLQGTSLDRIDWHPTQLPPELLSRIVLGWTDPGDVVLDAFAGSGSMGLVCKQHNRRFIGVDQSPLYVDKMKGRLCLTAPSTPSETCAVPDSGPACP